LEREPLAPPGQPGPQSLESTLMARQAANVCVREGTLLEAALPGRDSGHGGAVRPLHRSRADATVVRQVL
jgi:hypothetical protein